MEASSNYIREVSLTFQAFDEQNMPLTRGGDQFVLHFLGWMGSDADSIAYKTAVDAEDLSNGSYKASFKVPATQVKVYNMSLLHYNTCYQGYGPLSKDDYHKLDFWLTPITHNGLSAFLSEEKQNTQSFHEYPQGLPICDDLPDVIDQVLDGAWIEAGIAAPLSITCEAQWKPFRCYYQNDSFGSDNHAIHIGDSTMPKRTLEVGDPYHYYSKEAIHHNRWVKYLWNWTAAPLSNGTGIEGDVIVFGGGLHQLFAIKPKLKPKPYNAKTAVDLLSRMLCQLAVVSPAKLLMIGAPPVQQQLYNIVDITESNVLWLNSILRQRIHQVNGSIAEFCRNIDLATLWGSPDQAGNSAPTHVAKANFHRIGFQQSKEERALVRWFQALSKENLTHRYGNRTVVFADIHNVLLSRPECYRDKLHAMLPLGLKYFGVIKALTQSRRKMVP